MVEKVSMSHRAISGHVEGLGTAGRKRSGDEFVPQRERAGFIAEECLREDNICSISQRGQNKNCVG